MTGEEVTVRVGHDGPDSIDAASESLETQASFGIVLEGHSRPAHVHCRLGGDLLEFATLDQPNYYVDPSEETFVPVVVEDVPDAVEGTLELSTGYGAASVTIDVTVTPGPPSVDVDETFAKPPRDPEGDRPEATTVGERVAASLTDASGLETGMLGVLVLALLAIGLAAATAAVVGGAVAFLAFLVVVAGVVVAALLLVR